VLRLKGAASVPALSGDGRLFSGGADWILYAYRLEDRVLRERNSLYGPLPEGSYGFAPPSPWAGFDYNYSEAELNKRLAEINERIAAGNVGEDEAAYTAYLMEVSGCMLGPGVQAARPLAQVAHRAQAALLLGGIGSRETIPFLSTLFLKDPDPSVKTAAATAIGRIGVDPDGVALKAFAQAVNGGEEQVLTAAASSIGALCRFSGPPLSDSGVRLLNLLSGGTMPPRTRAQAVRELDGLRQQ
jgi:outer membrane protein assembly factor BamB